MRKQLHDITVRLQGKELVLENDGLRRAIDLSRAVPRTISLTDKTTGFEYASPERADGDFSFLGYNFPHYEKAATAFSLVDVEVASHAASRLNPEHMAVRLQIRDAVQDLQFIREYVLFPGRPYMISRAAIRCPVQPLMYWTRRGGLHRNDNLGIAEYSGMDPAMLESTMDSLRFREDPTGLRRVEFRARTDYTNDLLEIEDLDPQSGPRRFDGNICLCAFAGGQGLFFLQEAPHSNERRDFEDHDFRYEHNTLYSLCWGIQPHEVREDGFLWGYRHVLGLFRGGRAEGAAAVRRYQTHRFPRHWESDPLVMVNPWGCGCFTRLMSEAFLGEEFHAASELGASHYQIDDGWERGGTLAEFTRNNRAADMDFWEVNRDVLPGGFEKLVQAATECGIEPALWIAPSSSREHRDGEDFAALLLAFHRKHGIRHFKFDGIVNRTKTAEDRLEAMLKKTAAESDGEIVIDFDLTNGQRQGYLLFQEYGLVFLANRYVCHHWGMLYHPEITLHNVWQYAHYLRLQNLFIEVCDPHIINYDYFNSKKVEPPDIYDPEYWAALALFGNPLLWLAPSRLPPETKKTYRRIMDLHREHRAGIFAGDITPVGPEPDGAALMGFLSHREEDDAGYLVVYREHKASETADLTLPLPAERAYRFTSVSDDAPPVDKKADRETLPVLIDRPGWYRLYRYEAVGG